MKFHNDARNSILQSTLKRELFCFLFLTAVIYAIYGQVIVHEFTSFDDPGYVANNVQVQKGVTVEGIKWAFKIEKHDGGYYWHPVTWLSHMLDVSMFGNNAGLHLLINVLWHILNTFFIYIILLRQTKKFWLSIITASLFAVHPLNVETVAWVSERKSLISTFLGLLTVAVYFRYSFQKNIINYFFVVITYTFGLMAKPMFVTLPILLLLLDYWPLERVRIQGHAYKKIPSYNLLKSSREVFLIIFEKLPLLLIAFLVTFIVHKSASSHSIVVPYSVVPLTLRIENFIVSISAYIWKLFFPFNLAVFYPYPDSISPQTLILSGLSLIFLSVVIIWKTRNFKYLAVGWLWFLISLIPVSGLIQAGLWPSMADRWTYVPYIGLFLLFSGLFDSFLRKTSFRTTFLLPIPALIVLYFGFLSYHQVKHWENSETLFTQALKCTENNHVMHNNLAAYYSKTGKIEEAIEQLTEAIRISPGYIIARSNLVDLLKEQNRHSEASQIYIEGLKYRPNVFSIKAETNKKNLSNVKEDSPETINTSFEKAMKLASEGKLAQAEARYQSILYSNPNHFGSLNNLAMIYTQKGENEKAVVLFKRALAISQDDANVHYNLAYTYAAANLKEDAINHFRKALELRPDSVIAHNNLGIVLAQKGNTNEAIKHFKRALEYDPKSFDAHLNMGVISYHLGQRDKANHHFKKAIEIDPSDKRVQSYLKFTKPQ